MSTRGCFHARAPGDAFGSRVDHERIAIRRLAPRPAHGVGSAALGVAAAGYMPMPHTPTFS